MKRNRNVCFLKLKEKKQAIGTISKGAQILDLTEKDYKTTASIYSK